MRTIFKFNLIVLFGIFILIYRCPGQTVNTKFNADSSRVISIEMFNNLIDTCIILLQKQELISIPDSGHIKIMMCFNTVFVRHFKDGRYQKLLDLINERNYEKEIIKVYPEWIPNRGLGFYFPKLKMEFAGTPRRYAIYDVRK
jgi:hypothetical protein